MNLGGALILESGQRGIEEPLYGEELANLLDPETTCLAILSACQSACPWEGVAQALAAKGVPAVIGMQLPMRADISPQWARALYSALAQECDIEEALHQARRFLIAEKP